MDQQHQDQHNQLTIAFPTDNIEPIQTLYHEDYWVEPSQHSHIHPILAAIISVPCPGLGHSLNHQLRKGISLCVSCHILFFIASIFALTLVGLVVLPFVALLWICIIIDAYQVGMELKRGRPVMKGQCSNGVVAFTADVLQFKCGPVFDVKDQTQWPAEYTERLSRITSV